MGSLWSSHANAEQAENVQKKLKVTRKEVQKIWIDTDIGNDVDDALALMISAFFHANDEIEIVGLSTVFFDPSTKAKIAKTIYDGFGINVPIYAGRGIYRNEDGSFSEQEMQKLATDYPAFPVKQFKEPWSDKSISRFEALSYKEKNDEGWDTMKFEPNTCLEALKNAVYEHGENLTIVSLGFLSNIADAWEIIELHNPQIFAMTGWFENDGIIQRLGYNLVCDLKAGKTVLQQDKVQVTIVNSDICKLYSLNKSKYEKLINLECKNKVVQAIQQDMKIWVTGKKENGITKEETLGLADALTMFLAVRTQKIKKQKNVKITIGDYREGISMFSAGANEYITVTKVDQSNVTVITEIEDITNLIEWVLHSMFAKLEI